MVRTSDHTQGIPAGRASGEEFVRVAPIDRKVLWKVRRAVRSAEGQSSWAVACHVTLGDGRASSIGSSWRWYS
jgi:hypothetical protein